MPLLVLFDKSTREPNKLTTGFNVHFADNGFVM